MSEAPDASARNPYYPAFVDLRGRRVLVVGGGAVAARKVADLTLTGAEIVVVAPEADPAVVRLAAEGRLVWRRRTFREADLDGAFVLVAAADARSANARAAQDARRRGVLVNAVDDPPNCDLIAPAVVRRGALTLAISTGGGSPAVARFMRELLETVIGEEYGQLLAVASEARREVVGRGLLVAPERWQAGLAEALGGLRAGDDPARARERLLEALIGAAPAMSSGSSGDA